MKYDNFVTAAPTYILGYWATHQISLAALSNNVEFMCAHRCDISGGVGVEWPVECHEVWRFHNGSATLQLMGFAAVHPEVHVAKHLERQQDDKRRQQAIWMLQSMNQ